MPSKAKGQDHVSDGDAKKKKKKKEKEKKSGAAKAERCGKCETLLPIMHKMKDLLAKLQPQCNQYRVSLLRILSSGEPRTLCCVL